MKKIIVLGAGMVGSAIAIDLHNDYDVYSADINQTSLNELSENNNISTIQADLSNFKKVKEIIADFDLVIGAVPGWLGFDVVKTVISCGKDIVDISFFPEDCFELDELAKKHNVTAIVDCGVAPGMSNLILGYHNKRMKVENFVCMVGGLPFVREFPFEYKAPFSPVDVIEEYTRPARYVENGSLVVKPALSDAEYVFFENIGTLEAFNSDGLRTLINTIKVPNMIEKTLRYPGHIQYIKALKEAGFFSALPLEINGTEIRPIDFTSKLLFKKWKLGKQEEEFTVMRIIVEGEEEGMDKIYTYNLFDRFDKLTNISSMARTTGYTCTAAARMLLDGKFSRKGIIPPEYIGESEECFDFIINYLKERNVVYWIEEIQME